MPRVSIVTALYNHRPFLAERVRSILHQTFGDLEWIVVDDCSTDGSYEEITRLTERDARVKVLRNETNLGHMLTNQRGLDRAEGAYVYRVDSDDSCDRRFLEVMTGVLDANPASGFAYCRSLRMDVRNGTWGGFPRQSGRYIKAPEAFPEFVLDYPIRAPSLVFRRRQLEHVGGFDRRPPGMTGEWHADWHLALRMALVTDLVFHPEPLAYHRTHASNLSRDMRLTLNNFPLLDDIFDHLPEACRRYDALRPEAYRRVARRIYADLRILREVGSDDAEFNRGMALIEKYVPGIEPPPGRTLLRDAMRSAASAAIKLATYRRRRSD